MRFRIHIIEEGDWGGEYYTKHSVENVMFDNSKEANIYVSGMRNSVDCDGSNSITIVLENYDEISKIDEWNNEEEG